MKFPSLRWYVSNSKDVYPVHLVRVGITGDCLIYDFSFLSPRYFTDPSNLYKTKRQAEYARDHNLAENCNLR